MEESEVSSASWCSSQFLVALPTCDDEERPIVPMDRLLGFSILVGDDGRGAINLAPIGVKLGIRASPVATPTRPLLICERSEQTRVW